MIGFLIFVAIFFLVIVLAYLLIPPGNFVHEGLRLPLWLWRLNSLEMPKQPASYFRYGKHPRQYICYYKPSASLAERKNVVIYIHGSGWQFGKPEMFKANAQWLVNQGYHSFFISHRRIPWCDIRGLRQDIGDAMQFIVSKFGELGLSGKKILFVGNSAGGNLAALALLDSSILNQETTPQGIFSGLALFAAPLDLDAMWPSPPLMMVTKWKNSEVYKMANPVQHLHRPIDIPVLLVHGDQDGIVEFANAANFQNRLMALGASNVTFKCLENGMHLDSASWCFPGHPATQIFQEWLNSVEQNR